VALFFLRKNREKKMAAKNKENWVNRVEHKTAEQQLYLKSFERGRERKNRNASQWMKSVIGEKFVLNLKLNRHNK